jgi:hypothetical protein
MQSGWLLTPDCVLRPDHQTQALSGLFSRMTLEGPAVGIKDDRARRLNFWESLAQVVPQVRSLSMKDQSSNMDGLEKMNVITLKANGPIKSFIMRCPNLKALSMCVPRGVQIMDHYEIEFYQLFASLKNLTQLRLTGFHPNTKEAIDALKSLPNLGKITPVGLGLLEHKKPVPYVEIQGKYNEGLLQYFYQIHDLARQRYIFPMTIYAIKRLEESVQKREKKMRAEMAYEAGTWLLPRNLQPRQHTDQSEVE